MEGWQEYKLGRFINVMSGAAFKSEDFVSSGTPIVKIGNIVDGTIKPTNDDSFFPTSALPQYKDYILEENDVLIAMSGNTTCKMGRVPKEYSPSLLNQRVGLIQICDTFSSEISIDYVYHLLMSDIYQRKLWSYATATGQPNLSPRDIKRLKFRKPFFSEQIAIANILSKVDDAIASVQNSIAAAERLKKSLMQNLLTGRMKPDGTFRTPEEFYIDEKFGKVPVGWGVKRVDEVFDFYPTASYSRSMLKEDGECKYIHYGDIHTRFDIFLDISEESLPYITNDMIKKFVFLKDGDIVISDTSEDYDGVGKLVELINVGESKVISGLHTLLLRPKTDELLNGFKGYLFNEERVRLEFLKYVTGIKVYSISKNSLSKVLLPIPTRIEQEQIKENLDAVNNEMYVSKNKIKKLERLKKSLMQNLLTGRVSMARS